MQQIQLPRRPREPSHFNKHYKIIENLGKGQFGEVYKCQNLFDQQIYAVKIMKEEGFKALNEAQALASLNVLFGDKYIVRYNSSWVQENRTYIVMECCKQSLLGLLKNNEQGECLKVEEFTIWKILIHICKALSKIHQNNTVHLDIKPENILQSQSGVFKISDLGLAKALYDKNDANTLREGDSRYMAKELLRDYNFDSVNNARVDITKADIFSLGMTILKVMLGDDIELESNGRQWNEIREGKIPFLK